MIARQFPFRSFLAICTFVSVSADHNYLLGNVFLGENCAGNPVHYYVFGYDMTGNLNKPGSTPCSEWLDQSGGTGYGTMEITGAYSLESGTGAYTIIANEFSSDKCTYESHIGHDSTVIPTGQCIQIPGGGFSYSFEYHDTAPQLPIGQEFLVEAFYESKATCLADNVPANKLAQLSEGRAFSLDVCIPQGASSSAKYTSDKMLYYYASAGCTGTPTQKIGPIPDIDDKCEKLRTADAYPGSWESGDTVTYARTNLYHYQAYIKMSAKEGPKMPKGGAKSKAKQ